MRKTISILVTGRVQGVMFRQSVKKLADSLQIFGYAENLLDGKVKIVGVGSEESLKKLLEFSYSGSLMSKVESVFFEWGEEKKDWHDFQIKREKNNLVSDQINAFSNLGKKLFHTSQPILISNLELPKHLVIIPDGNRRWAKIHGLPIFMGHKKGFERAKEIIEYLKDSKVQSITIWAFSTENWKREKDEVENLMKIFLDTIDSLRKTCLENKIVFRHFGRKNILDSKVIEHLQNLEQDTKAFADLPNSKNINLAIDYGGRDEIVRAINSIPGDTEITEKHFEEYLDTRGISDPDLIIRTSGEKRLSGILPWQSVYSELYFTDKHFPDFDIDQLNLALLDFSNRKRRFGQ